MFVAPDPVIPVPAIAGLGILAPHYRALLCDVWGVLHNGVVPFLDAAEALIRFRAGGGLVMLITNAPRPADSIRAQLAAIGVPAEAHDGIVTSGDVTRSVLVEAGLPVFHLGPSRDDPLYAGLPVILTSEAGAGIVCCTGLIDDETETVDDYDLQLARLAARGLPMVCANPDLVVERGGRLIPCAGALAVRYRELGGAVTLIGKPWPAIYDAAFAMLSELAGRKLFPREVLAIGDGVETDVRGAAMAGMDALFVTSGIHAAVYGSEPAALAAFLNRHDATPVATIDRLRP